MRVTVEAFGLVLDVTFGPTEPDTYEQGALDAGTDIAPNADDEHHAGYCFGFHEGDT